LASDKVFFHFFENILNGHRRTFVSPQLRFMPFYRISQCLPSKKNKKMQGYYSRQITVVFSNLVTRTRMKLHPTARRH
jgi:hypothetical protein